MMKLRSGIMNADIQKYAWMPVMRFSKAGKWTNTTTMLMQYG